MDTDRREWIVVIEGIEVCAPRIAAVLTVNLAYLGNAAEASLVADVQAGSNGQTATTVLDTHSGFELAGCEHDRTPNVLAG